MTPEKKRPFLLFGGFAILFTVFAVLLIRVLPADDRPFEYMVAGTFATAVALVVVFIIVARQRSS